MHWAARSWHVLAARATVDGILGRPGCPSSLLGLDPLVLLAYVEGVLRESSEASKTLDKIWADSRPKSPEARADEISRALASFA